MEAAGRGAEQGAAPGPRGAASSSEHKNSGRRETAGSTEVESESSFREGATEQAPPASGTEDHRILPGGITKESSSLSLNTLSSSPQDMSSREKSDNGKEVGSETNLQERATAQTASDTGPKGILGILGGIRKETSFLSLHKLSSERKMSAYVDASARKKPSGISVSIQTETSWLYEHVYRKPSQRKMKEFEKTSAHVDSASKTDMLVALSQELASIGILCDTEFNEDFVKLFEESLWTLPCIGLPALLAYKPESSRENMQIEIEEECVPVCEYCGSPLKVFPSYEYTDPTSEDYQMNFCCENSRDLYKYIVNESQLYEKSKNESISIDPHEAHGSETERQRAREKAYLRQQERQIVKQLAYVTAEQTSFIEYSKQLNTISYQLSREPPWSGTYTLPSDETVKKEEGKDINYSITCCDFTIVGGKLAKNQFLEKYYRHGGKFLTLFPDGTSQVFYPSGNLAVIVVNKKGGLICIVQEDKPTNAAIQAVFESSGKSTCYHPNGIIWININIQEGHYLDQAGNRVRVWTWPSHLKPSGSRIPFKPIFISLNQYLGVRIYGQDKIMISFLAMGQQAKFIVGTKVQVRQRSQLPSPKFPCEEELLLFACKIKIQHLFDRLQRCLNFPSNEQWDKIKPPSYLATQALKLMYLCKNSGISEDLDSSVRAIINTPV
ncbi:glutamate-rich protein 6 [Alligator mississippiensis]|uniref:Glutamate-rich protein 6 n=1 Tax=Alligator mississippiensis TaxID=8496 RepID=A0A151NB34_ALLMI|nr:glutamate-rich protein 6 [Alligator mississippiensis]